MYFDASLKVDEIIKKIHKDSDPGSLSYSLDIWSTRSGKSITATRVHYIDNNWQLINKTIEFEEFNERHTAVNIRDRFEQLLNLYDSSASNVSMLEVIYKHSRSDVN